VDTLRAELGQHKQNQQLLEQLAAQQEKSLLAELESRAQQLEEANNRLSVETERTRHVQQALEASDLVVLDLRRQLQELDQAHVAQQQELEDLHTELEQLFYSERQNIESLDRLEQEAQVLRKGLGDSEERRRADHIKLEQIQNDIATQQALFVSQKEQLRESHIRLEESLQSLLDKEIELERLRVLQAETDFQGKREQKLMVERQVDLEKELGTLRGSLQRDSANLEHFREDNQHLLGALHETEEELEHYFLQTQNARQLIDAQQLQLQRAAALMQRMAALKGISVGVPISPPIQVMALLEGYRHSLKRAERLLGREVFSGEASRISE
jgi:chromosome segregation ATPase